MPQDLRKIEEGFAGEERERESGAYRGSGRRFAAGASSVPAAALGRSG